MQFTLKLVGKSKIQKSFNLASTTTNNSTFKSKIIDDLSTQHQHLNNSMMISKRLFHINSKANMIESRSFTFSNNNSKEKIRQNNKNGKLKNENFHTTMITTISNNNSNDRNEFQILKLNRYFSTSNTSSSTTNSKSTTNTESTNSSQELFKMHLQNAKTAASLQFWEVCEKNKKKERKLIVCRV